MSFFNISTKAFVCIIIYFIIVYTMMYGVGLGASYASTDDVSVLIPSPILSRTNVDVSQAEARANASIDVGNFIIFGLIGAVIVGLLTFGIGGALLVGVVSAAGVKAIALGGAVLGFIEVGGVGSMLREHGIDLGFNDFARAVGGFFGSILDLFNFMASFMTFGYIGDAFDIIPTEYTWIPFIMTFPVWIYITIALAGFAVEAWRSVKGVLFF